MKKTAARIMGERDGYYGLQDFSDRLVAEAREDYAEGRVQGAKKKEEEQ